LRGKIRREKLPEAPSRETFQSAKRTFQRNPYATNPAKQFGNAGTNAKLSYKEGDRVRHMKFGEGTVEQIISGGRDFEVTVNFDNFGTKKMFASFAKLQKV
jgi:DNA helicase-2/ATP-dependent DNA helicase PcrA